MTRQWQLGELQAEDAASPIDARLATRLAPFERVSLAGGPPKPYDETLPLEVAVEREDVPWTLPARIEAAEMFLRRVPAAVRGVVATAARAKFPLDADPDWRREPDALGLQQIANRREFDGAKMLASHRAGTLAGDLGVAAAQVVPAAGAVAAWGRRVFGATFDTPPAPPPAWIPDHLAYDVRIGTGATANGEQALLTARRYADGRLDWYSFEMFDERNEVFLESLESNFSGQVPAHEVRAATLCRPAKLCLSSEAGKQEAKRNIVKMSQPSPRRSDIDAPTRAAS